MPNLDRRPHLLSRMSMTERERQANTASATATETWWQRGQGSGRGPTRSLFTAHGMGTNP